MKHGRKLKSSWYVPPEAPDETTFACRACGATLKKICVDNVFLTRMPTITLDHWCQTRHIGLLLRGTCQRVSTEDKSISWDATRFIPRHLSAWVNILIVNVGLDAAGQVEQAGQTESVLAVVRLELSGQIVCGQSRFTLIPRTSNQHSKRPKSGKDARRRVPSSHQIAITPPPSPSPRPPPWQNHLRSLADSSAVRCVASCPAKSRPRAVGTRVAVPFVC